MSPHNAGRVSNCCSLAPRHRTAVSQAFIIHQRKYCVRQVAMAEAHGHEMDEAAPEVQAARAAEREAAEQMVAHEAQVNASKRRLIVQGSVGPYLIVRCTGQGAHCCRWRSQVAQANNGVADAALQMPDGGELVDGQPG